MVANIGNEKAIGEFLDQIDRGQQVEDVDVPDVWVDVTWNGTTYRLVGPIQRVTTLFDNVKQTLHVD